MRRLEPRGYDNKVFKWEVGPSHKMYKDEGSKWADPVIIDVYSLLCRRLLNVYRTLLI